MSLSLFLAVTLIPQNALADRLVPLASAEERHCTAGLRWCVSLAEAQDARSPPVPVVRAGDAAAPLSGPTSDDLANETYAVWPHLILLAHGGFLAGVEVRTSTAYSGGGGSATELRLFRVGNDGQADAKPVLTVPVGASLLIRACFGERDMRNRRGACHDEYSFSGDIALAHEAATGLPMLIYVSEAHAFPRGVSRMADSNARPRLKKSDLVRERDAACSVTRRFRYDAVAGSYRPDTPLPDCEAYTVP